MLRKGNKKKVKTEVKRVNEEWVKLKMKRVPEEILTYCEMGKNIIPEAGGIMVARPILVYRPKHLFSFIISVVEPELQGAKTFGRSRSQYSEVLAPAPGSGSD